MLVRDKVLLWEPADRIARQAREQEQVAAQINRHHHQKETVGQVQVQVRNLVVEINSLVARKQERDKVTEYFQICPHSGA